MTWTLAGFPGFELPDWLKEVPEFESDDSPRFRWVKGCVRVWVYTNHSGRDVEISVHLDYLQCPMVTCHDVYVISTLDHGVAELAFRQAVKIAEEHGSGPPGDWCAEELYQSDGSPHPLQPEPPPLVRVRGVASAADVALVNRHRRQLGMKPLDWEDGWTATEVADMARRIRGTGTLSNPAALKRRLLR